MSPMGGQRHTGVGMKRKVKRKVLPAEDLPSEVAGSGGESEEEPEDDQEVPEAVCTCLKAANICSKFGPEFSKLAFNQARENMIAAKKDVLKFEKKWSKVKKTYVDSGRYSPWAEESVVKRIKLRLFNADYNLANARLSYMRARTRWVRLRSFHMLLKQWLPNPGEEPLEQFYFRAFDRVVETFDPAFPKRPYMTMWPGWPGPVKDFNQRHFGLAMTWGLSHVDHMRPLSNDPEQSERAQQRRVQATAAANHKKWEQEQGWRGAFINSQAGFAAKRAEEKGGPSFQSALEAYYVDCRFVDNE